MINLNVNNVGANYYSNVNLDRIDSLNHKANDLQSNAVFPNDEIYVAYCDFIENGVVVVDSHKNDIPTLNFKK